MTRKSTLINKIPLIDTSLLLSTDTTFSGEDLDPLTGCGWDPGQDNYIVVFTGPKGSGKTGLAVLFAIKSAYLYNFDIFSNIKIEAKLRTHDPGHQYITIKSKPLDWNLVYSLDRGLDNSLILVDEAPIFADSKGSQRIAQRLIGYSLMQSRHSHVSWFFTAISESWLDTRIRASMDLKLACRDASKFCPTMGLRRGEWIWVDLYDTSGQMTGRPYGFNSHDEWGYHETFDVHLGSIFGAWSTLESQDPFEALSKVDVSNRTTYDLGKKEKDAETIDRIGETLRHIRKTRSGDDLRIESEELRTSINDVYKIDWDSRKLGQVLKSLGCTRHQVSGGYIYDLSGVDPGTDNNDGVQD